MPNKHILNRLHRAGLIGALCSLAAAQQAIAQTYFPQAGMPEAHYWQDLPGVLVVKPQATVRSIFSRNPDQISLNQLMRFQSPNLMRTYTPKTDQQWAREDAQRETVSNRFGESAWHYGWGVGFEDIRLRVSFDF